MDTVLHLCEVATLTEPFDIVFLLLKAYDTRWGCELINAGLALGYEIVPIFGLDDVDPTRPHEYVRALFEKLMDDFVLETTCSTVLQDWIRGRHSEVNEIHGAVVAALPKGSATVNETMIELALQIERGERARDRSNLEGDRVRSGGKTQDRSGCLLYLGRPLAGFEHELELVRERGEGCDRDQRLVGGDGQVDDV